VYHTDVDDGEHVALVKGDIQPDEPVLVRAHAEFLPGDVFNMAERDTAALLHQAMEDIGAAGKGIVLYLRRDGRGAEILELQQEKKRSSRPSTDTATLQRDFRDYGIGAQILRDIGVRKIRLLSNYPRNLVSLPGYDLEILECVPLKIAGARRGKRNAAAPVRRRAR
jgi:3,4-dihydroxy 2-butanone 4-phosphate synthase / GTP cyclohydrolase II